MQDSLPAPHLPSASHKNSLHIIGFVNTVISKHRIVAKNELGGYAGATDGTLINFKKWLLQHESGHKQVYHSKSKTNRS